MNLYVDDTGAMKGLPDNARAAGLAAAAGHPCEVHGDAFVARVVDSEDEFRRLDFTLAEVASDAAWIPAAQARNARRRANAGKMADLVPGGVAIEPGKAAAEAEAAHAQVDATQQSVAGALYTYSQDTEEVVVEVAVPPETKARDVALTVKAETISLVVATLPEAQRAVLQGALFQKVLPAECSWSLATHGGGRVLQLTLTKALKLRWLGVLRSG